MTIPTHRIVNGCCRLPKTLRGKPIDELAGVEYRVVHPKHPRPEAQALIDALRQHAEDWRDAEDVAWSRR